MRWSEIIELVSIAYEKDELRQEIPVETKRKVRANAWTISFSEKMSAGMDTMRGSHRFEVQTHMYHGEEKAIYRDKPYQVDAERRGHRTILTLTEVSNASS